MAQEYDLIQISGDTYANTMSNPPMLADRELWIEKQSDGSTKVKRGDGTTPYQLLPYIVNNHIVFDAGTANPTSAQTYQAFYRTDLHKLVVYDGSKWYDTMGNVVT